MQTLISRREENTSPYSSTSQMDLRPWMNMWNNLFPTSFKLDTKILILPKHDPNTSHSNLAAVIHHTDIVWTMVRSRMLVVKSLLFKTSVPHLLSNATDLWSESTL